MIWLAWRQLRSQALIVAGVLVVLAIVLALNGAHLVHLYDTSVATCGQHNDCSSVLQNFDSQAKWNHVLGALVLATPALIGVFWGAPLVARELETRTSRLVWTQSVTRARWFSGKLAVVGTASVVTAALVTWMVTWWATPYDRTQGVPYAVFDQRDIVPVAYAIFAVALGVAVGAIIRRTLPAMAVTLVAFVTVRIFVSQWLRLRLLAPVRMVTQFTLPTGVGTRFGPPGTGSLNQADWFISEQILNRNGRVIGQDGGIGPNATISFGPSANGGTVFEGVGKCPNAFPAPPSGVANGQSHVTSVSPAMNDAVQRCIASFHLRSIVTLEPQSRYWAFQWYEAAIFIGAAAVLAALCFWWIRHRIT